MLAHLHALLVGIDAYPHPSVPPLEGCVNDVRAMRRLLDTRGVPSDQVRTLTDDEATRDGIESAFAEHLIAAGDRWRDGGQQGPPPGFLFYFSGHGSQAEDPTGVEPDGLDETLVPFDAREDDVFDIKDFELAGWLARLPGDDVTVILDCCHSGSATRATNERSRMAPPDPRPQPARRPPTLGPTRGVSLAGGGRHVLLAACSAHQEAFEYHGADDGLVRGRFSYFLVPELDVALSEDDPTTYRDLHDRVWLDVAADAREQRPQCEGDVDRVLFGDTRLERSGTAHVLGVRRGLVWTDVGQVHGVTPGTRLAIAVPDGADVVVEVERVEPVRSAGRVVDDGGRPELPPLRGRRASLTRFELGQRRWRLRDDADVLASVGGGGYEPAALTGLVEVVTEPDHADLHAVRDGGELVLHDARGRRLMSAVDASAFTAALAHVARWAWLLALGRDDLGPDLPPGTLGLTPLTVGVDAFSGETRETELPRGRDGAFEATAGQRLAFRIDNGTRYPLQVGMLAFTSDWQVTVLHPPIRGAQDRAAARRGFVIGRHGSSFEASTLDGGDTTSWLRLIGTTHPTSFEPLIATPPEATWAAAAPLPPPAAGPRPAPSEPLLPRQGRRLPSRWLSTTVELISRSDASRR